MSEGGGVGVLEFAAHGQAQRQAGDADAERLDELGEVDGATLGSGITELEGLGCELGSGLGCVLGV